MTPTAAEKGAKKATISLTANSKIRVRSAGPDDSAIESTGVFRGLVSIAGDNSIAVELDGSNHEVKGRIRLVPLSALLAIDILEAGTPEEEKRAESPTTPGYFR